MSYNTLLSIDPGESLKSTVLISNHSGLEIETNFNLTIRLYNTNDTDTYWEAYAKRLNYWVYNEENGQELITQGTMWYYPPSGVDKAYVSYSKTNLAWGKYRLYFSSPDLNTMAIGEIRFYV